MDVAFLAYYDACQGSICFRLCVISGLSREADENYALMGYYAASGDTFLRTFRDNLSRAKNVLFVFWFLDP